MPLPRTAHFLGNVVVHKTEAALIEAQASWMVQIYQPRAVRREANFGLCEVRLTRHGETWRIARKKMQLQNDSSGRARFLPSVAPPVH